MSEASEAVAHPIRNEALDAPVHIGAVSLRVRDLAGLTAFYRDAIGLSVISQDADQAVLGAGGEPLVKLEAGAQHPSSAAGLFHMAILLPSRRDLGNWLRHAAETGVGLEGASNHLVSEALYLSDPEGNGIEIYRDRGRAEWPRLDGGPHPGAAGADDDDVELVVVDAVDDGSVLEFHGMLRGHCAAQSGARVSDGVPMQGSNVVRTRVPSTSRTTVAPARATRNTTRRRPWA